MTENRQGQPVPGSVWSGVVVAYDAEVGFGEAESNAGERRGFHCVSIADGSRRIDVGARILCRLVAGPTGQWELAAVAPVNAAAGTPRIGEA